MLLAPGVAKTSSPLPLTGSQSPLRVCLKFLQDGHDPVAALEFVAEWGPADIKRQFEGYVKLLKLGRPLVLILEEMASAYPSPESELLVASIEARIATGAFPGLTADVLNDTEGLGMRSRSEMETVIGSSRRWALGLVGAGLLGGGVLIIAVQHYSQALLHSGVGRVVLGIVIVLEIIGLAWAGLLLRLQARNERELSQL